MMKIKAQAAVVGLMFVVSGCGSASAPVTPSASAALPAATTAAVVSASPTVAPAPATATPAAATVQPAASSTPQPSAAAAATAKAAVPSAAVKEAATATPSPSSSVPAPASAAPSPSSSVPKAADNGNSTAAQAQVLYKDNCMACHGAGLAGDFGPNLTKVGSHKTKDEIATQILGGKGDMPGFKGTLKTEEVEVLAAWLAAKK